MSELLYNLTGTSIYLLGIVCKSENSEKRKRICPGEAWSQRESLEKFFAQKYQTSFPDTFRRYEGIFDKNMRDLLYILYRELIYFLGIFWKSERSGNQKRFVLGKLGARENPWREFLCNSGNQRSCQTSFGIL